MTKHQKLILIRHLQAAERAYMRSIENDIEELETEVWLKEVREMLEMVYVMPTSD